MALIEVYRSPRRADCDERALVLAAVGIEAEVASLGECFALLVVEESVAAALPHLEQYREESRRRLPPPPAVRLHEEAWLGSFIYVVVLIGIAHLAASNWLGADWFSAGDLAGARLEGGQWWRAITALTLHADAGHLIANLGFGALFGYFLGQLIGPGIAWASILGTGALGNVLDAVLMPPEHHVIGASTAVFATLGLLAGCSWRARLSRGTRWSWPYRWGPLIAAVALLAITGTGGLHTDVLAHLTGFVTGTLLGALYGGLMVSLADRSRLQLISGAAALAGIVGAWACALA